MVDTAYRVVPRSKHRFDVEMAKPNGRRKMIEGFGSEHEANAWIVQTQRMIRAASPWTPLSPRKPNVVTVAQLTPASSLAQVGQPRVQDTGNHARKSRALVKAARERTAAKP
jgi:hypothetical protein